VDAASSRLSRSCWDVGEGARGPAPSRLLVREWSLGGAEPTRSSPATAWVVFGARARSPRQYADLPRWPGTVAPGLRERSLVSGRRRPGLAWTCRGSARRCPGTARGLPGTRASSSRYRASLPWRRGACPGSSASLPRQRASLSCHRACSRGYPASSPGRRAESPGYPARQPGRASEWRWWPGSGSPALGRVEMEGGSVAAVLGWGAPAVSMGVLQDSMGASQHAMAARALHGVPVATPTTPSRSAWCGCTRTTLGSVTRWCGCTRTTAWLGHTMVWEHPDHRLARPDDGVGAPGPPRGAVTRWCLCTQTTAWRGHTTVWEHPDHRLAWSHGGVGAPRRLPGAVARWRVHAHAMARWGHALACAHRRRPSARSDRAVDACVPR
jgi:hypothetical protein